MDCHRRGFEKTERTRGWEFMIQDSIFWVEDECDIHKLAKIWLPG